MTVEEYSAMVELIVQNTELPLWQRLDLKLNLRFVKRRLKVDAWDELLLFLTKPWSGEVKRISGFTIERGPKPKQTSLF